MIGEVVFEKDFSRISRYDLEGDPESLDSTASYPCLVPLFFLLIG
jgi:hypothetical protein